MVEAARLPARVAREYAFTFVEGSLGLSRSELASPRRQAALVEARALFVWIVKSRGPERLSYPRIGRWLGNRDHSTIQHLFKVKAPQLRARDADFAMLCERFDECLRTPVGDEG